MPLAPAPLRTPHSTVTVDREGNPLVTHISPSWQAWYARLREEVRLISEMKQKTIIHSFDELPPGGDHAAVAWPVANLAFHVPFTVYEQRTVKRILVPVIVHSGNMDFGIYDLNKVRLVSSGSVPAMGSSVVQAVNIVNRTLDPGRYYMSMAVNNTVFQGMGCTETGYYNRLFGGFEKTSAFPLPATAVFLENSGRLLTPSFALDTFGGRITITYVGASARVNAASGNLTVTPPTTQTNDIMICAVSTADNVALSFPAGWKIYQEGNNTAGLRSTLAWKRCTGAEAAFVITHTAGGQIVANVAVYRDCVATGSPINTSSLQHNASSATCTAAAITPSIPGCLTVFSMHSAGPVASSAQAATDPATFTERFDNTGGGAGYPSVSGADGEDVDGGSTGNATGTLAIANVNSGGLTALTPLVK